MHNLLHPSERAELLKRGFTRRSFGRIAALVSAGSAMPFYNEAALAQEASRRAGMTDMPPGMVRISGNENPMGPAPEAAEAMRNIVQKGGYYARKEPAELAEAVAEVEGVKQDYVMPFAGSGDPLHRSVLAFCSPQKSFVMSDPGYESGAGSARFIGAKVIHVPLRKDHSHDVQAMVKADPNAGIIYICNPNNPSGTLTSKSDIEWAIANKPAGSIVLLDEAYIHISRAWEDRGSNFVAADKDVILLRTFSKLYGMAGLRAGFAMGRPDLLRKLQPWGHGGLPVTSMLGAAVSVKTKGLIQQRREIIANIRADCFEFLEKHNFSYIKSDTNFFMVDVRRPSEEFAKAMYKQGVMVGRTWPVWPNYNRVTVGSKQDMEKFKEAFLKVMA